MSGTGQNGGAISVTATRRGTNTTTSVTTYAAEGAWSVNMDVSSLQDGTITIQATATDSLGNTNTAQQEANKDTTGKFTLTGTSPDHVRPTRPACWWLARGRTARPSR